MKIQESAEDYLEMILILRNRNGQVRSKDIVNEMGFTKPSVSIAMKKLRENGFIKVDENGYIKLEETGYAIAIQTFDRHQTLTQLLKTAGVSEETAMKDACRMEHIISEESYQCLKAYFKQK
ncbi:metal-dependent transcriptional regulator [Anaerocolumna sp. MB42-C2]|uniref:metal-dependent transcriptional regulator n=1 Tax=Anaerocolumna sp. MB42-C2 TaxID=3070997 RepID=UPI0027DF3EBC|nr:metal-dependent transcriptional regulator [Anaerocolumna sp. MB42-C2]WMJ87085.1 metal-dependent transcriptional regulator [Anaerocolumna sp. MB42-C2]